MTDTPVYPELINVMSGNDGARGFIAVSGGNGELWLSYSVHANPDNNDEWRGEMIGMTAAEALRLAAELIAAATEEAPAAEQSP